LVLSFEMEAMNPQSPEVPRIVGNSVYLVLETHIIYVSVLEIEGLGTPVLNAVFHEREHVDESERGQVLLSFH
jgi:hypothetical protein